MGPKQNRPIYKCQSCCAKTRPTRIKTVAKNVVYQHLLHFVFQLLGLFHKPPLGAIIIIIIMKSYTKYTNEKYVKNKKENIIIIIIIIIQS